MFHQEKVWKDSLDFCNQQLVAWWLFLGLPVLELFSHQAKKKKKRIKRSICPLLCLLPLVFLSSKLVLHLICEEKKKIFPHWSDFSMICFRHWLERAKTEASLLLAGLVINPLVCLFVMTPDTKLSDPSHTGLSKQSTIITRNVSERCWISNKGHCLIPPRKIKTKNTEGQ